MCSFCLSKEPFLRTEVPPGALRDMAGPQRCQPSTGSWGDDNIQGQGLLRSLEFIQFLNL